MIRFCAIRVAIQNIIPIKADIALAGGGGVTAFVFAIGAGVRTADCMFADVDLAKRAKQRY